MTPMTWLAQSRKDFGWLKSIGGVGAPFVEGYPAQGTFEPNVAAQWSLNEASGNIVDRVSSITLSQVGTPTYSQTLSGIYSGLSPGISYADGNEHAKTTGTASLNISGSQDFVIEMWVQRTDNTMNQFWFSYNVTNSTSPGIELFSFNPVNLTLDLNADDATSAAFTFTTPNLVDGLPHKIRVTCQRTGNATCYFDGAKTNDPNRDISSFNGKTFTNAGFRMGGVYDGSGIGNFHGIIYAFRLTIGNSTNNSGGPNGG